MMHHIMDNIEFVVVCFVYPGICTLESDWCIGLMNAPHLHDGGGLLHDLTCIHVETVDFATSQK